MNNGIVQTGIYQPPCYAPVSACDDCGCAYVNPAQVKSFMVGVKPNEQALILQTAERASRLFDDAINAPHGYFALAPTNPFVKTLIAPGGSYLPLPLHVTGSVVSAHSRYGVYPRHRWAETDDGSHLILDLTLDSHRVINLGPSCSSGRECECTSHDGDTWAGIVSVVARWGMDCIPGDIEQAVLEYTALAYRKREPVAAVTMAIGNGGFVPDEMPLSWKLAVRKWQSHFRKQRSRFA